MEKIKRHLLNVLEDAKTKYKKILITGSLHSGKLALLQSLTNDLEVIDFNDEDVKKNVKALGPVFLEFHKMPLILRNVLNEPSLFRIINIKAENETKKGLLYMTGDKTLAVFNDFDESLLKDTLVLELTTLSLRELTNVEFYLPFIPNKDYLKKRKRKKPKIKDLWEYINKGSIPYAQNDNITFDEFYQNYLNELLVKMINGGNKEERMEEFKNFMKLFAINSGTLIDYKDFASKMNVGYQTIKKWVKQLVNYGLIAVINPYVVGSEKDYLKYPIFYFKDTGLLSYLLDKTNQNLIYENFVISEIVKSYLNANINYEKKIFFNEDYFIIKDGMTIYAFKPVLNVNLKALGDFIKIGKIKDRKVHSKFIIYPDLKFKKVNQNSFLLPVTFI